MRNDCSRYSSAAASHAARKHAAQAITMLKCRLIAIHCTFPGCAVIPGRDIVFALVAAIRGGCRPVHSIASPIAVAMHFTPLSPRLGLETCGVDASQPLADNEFVELERAFLRGQVLVLRNQRLTPRQYVDFARRFGPPEPHVIDQFHHPDDPNILILSNRRNNGAPVGLADAGTYFHTDYSYLQVPARATMLYSLEVPKHGGNTLFANQYDAYDGLSAAMKERIAPLIAIHHYGNRKVDDEMSRTAASPLTDEQKAK